MLSPAAMRYAATHDEIYTFDQGQAVVDHFEHIARENTVEIAHSGISNRDRPAVVKRARELRIVTEALGAVEYALWRLSHITDGTPRMYEVRDDVVQRLPGIPPHIAERMRMLHQQMRRRRRDDTHGLDNVEKQWLRDYLYELHHDLIAPEQIAHTDIVERIANYGRRLYRRNLIPRKHDWEEQFIIDKRDEILALYEWLRLVDVLQGYE